jgi:hypothetical protein
MADDLLQWVRQILVSLPHLLVYLAGLTFAFVKLRRSPRARTFVALGCGILLANAFSGLIAFPLLTQSNATSGAISSQTWWTVFGIASALAHFLGVALIVGAVFADRHDNAES